jgi:adenosylmethionine---8-amino-7-oxononanoate aminotransferase
LLSTTEILEIDRRHVWHPYSAMPSTLPIYAVQSAQGCELVLSDGRRLVDGMSSWWSAIHGYNHPELNRAAHQQIDCMSHVMFGGLTHEPAVILAKKLVDITPTGLNCVFFADSGSVSVEVAIKMAIQFWQARQRSQKTKLISLRYAYHGDTLGAMSVCDPITGMHHLFKGILPNHIFVDAPNNIFHSDTTQTALASMEQALQQNGDQVAAVIVEPIVQGAGGMRFYAAEYLRQLRQLCDRYEVLLIADEIATGFGRTGKLFACEHANIRPDILCLGKALTGGYMTLAATLCTDAVAEGIGSGEGGVFMHGPTFMGNPLACAVANASIDLLLSRPWQEKIAAIETQLERELMPCAQIPTVKSVRVLGGIGVIELHEPVNMAEITADFVARGVWLRPFGKLVYTMPPYIISGDELTKITTGICEVLAHKT